MIFGESIITPSSTLVTDPLLTTIELTKGLIYKFEFDFPPGSAGLLHCYLKYHETQIIPIKIGETLYGDNRLISFGEKMMMDVEPYEIVVVSYNNDTSYDHTLQIRIGLTTDVNFIMGYMPVTQMEVMKSMIDSMIRLQERLYNGLTPNPNRFLTNKEESDL